MQGLSWLWWYGCSCGNVFVAKHNKHLLTPSRKHRLVLHIFRDIQTVEKAVTVDQLTKLVKPRKELKKKLWNASHITVAELV